MRFQIAFITLIFGVSLVSAGFPFYGRCLHHSSVRNFNATRYEGLWYEIEKYFSYSDYGLSCLTHYYKIPKNGGQERNLSETKLNFARKGIRRNWGGDTRDVKWGKLEAASTRMEGRMEVSYQTETLEGMKTSPVKQEKFDWKDKKEEREAYWILDTDYDNFSVVWSCVHAGIMNLQDVVFLARERDPSIFVRGRALGVLQRRKLMTKLLFAVDQEDCPNLFKTISKSP